MIGKKQENNDIIEEQEEEVVFNDTKNEEEKTSTLEKQLEEAENKYKRAIADYQNLQKRSREERGEWIRSANKDLLLRILTVFDTLVLAFGHLEDKNLKVSIDQFLDVLKSEGVVRIETVGKQFDPSLMEAITTEPGEEGKVLHEIRAGFLLNDKLLRAAQVTVGAQGKE